MKYKISEYAKLNHVTYRTVWNWIKDGKLDVERTSTGRIQIVIDDAKEQVVAIYARISSSENKDNLDRQAQRLIDYSKNRKGSGIWTKRSTEKVAIHSYGSFNQFDCSRT